jgi:Protein of unknown function (DUF1559)
MKLRYLFLFVILVLGATFFVRAILEAREAARDVSCKGHMNQLQLALTNYESQHGHLPPAYIVGPDGKPWHSWRVLILPYFEEQEFYDQYRFDEPWNGPNNRKLGDRVMNIFQCPRSSDFERAPTTNYVVVVGDETAFPGDRTIRFADFRDGVENTILLVEVADSGIHWMDPRDIEFDSLSIRPSASATPTVSSPHPKGPAVVFADKIHAYRLQQPLQINTLRALLTVAGDEPITLESLIQADRPSVLTER